MEALLIIWILPFTQNSVMPVVRYESMEQCELAKDAINNDNWINSKSWFRKSFLEEDIHCVAVPKAVK